ncbi:hypothetical protein L9Z41_17285 [Leptospira noguchii]|uniref:hypothetical protein n=1 Tax=Leptospira noguchii TaxID=28182 RepID=UPI001F05575E|nr:hypothetical protein [Leptospira noguchii]MCH1911857.1 hypothetical protein [Leptospira noguchii]MCH1917334.1 hypothetical protein [Leptospira noguchii]UOG63015.1 hypothetical protein MAL04_11420 [Leptospira noguchii]
MSLDNLKFHLKPGKVYRRSDLLLFSPSVDRELSQLVKQGFLKKEATGLYFRPKKGKFGDVPASISALVEKYLKTKDFLIVDHNTLNSMNLGLTQLYTVLTVYNQKRHGLVELGGVRFNFKRRSGYPQTLSPEFLLVELLNERKTLPEIPVDLKEKMQKLVKKLNRAQLKKFSEQFGKVAVKKEFKELLSSHK